MSTKRKHTDLVDGGSIQAVTAEASMKVIRRSKVPEYLQCGQLFKSLNPDDDEEISVPANVMKMDDSVYTVASLTHLLSTLRYWMVDGVPKSIICYVLDHRKQTCASVVRDFGEQFPILRALQAVQREPRNKRMVKAFELGELEIIRYLYKDGLEISTACAEECARHGYPECLRFHFECGGAVPVDFEYTIVISSGHVECLKLAHAAGCALTDLGATWANQNNFVECLRYYHAHGIRFITQSYTVAARWGCFACLKFLHEEVGLQWHPYVTLAAANYGHLDCLTYAFERGCPMEEDCAVVAAKEGHLHILQYIHEHGGAWNEMVPFAALKMNQFPCLRYALEHNCPTDPAVLINYAARAGHLQCLQYLHESGFQWDWETTATAAANNHLECLQYAVEHGCPVTQQTLDTAIEHRSWRCIEYLRIVLSVGGG